MYLQTSFALLLSVLNVVVQAQSDTCSRLSNYQPALSYCATSYPPAVPTVTSTITRTIARTTSSAASTTIPTSSRSSSTSTRSSSASTKSSSASVQGTTTKASTTSSNGGNGRTTRTITAVAEVTVTDCRAAYSLACPYSQPASSASPAVSSSSGRVSTTSSARTSTSATLIRPAFFGNLRGSRGPREAAPEPEPEPQRGGWSGAAQNLQVAVWINVLARGTPAVKSVCSCIGPGPTRTATVSMIIYESIFTMLMIFEQTVKTVTVTATA